MLRPYLVNGDLKIEIKTEIIQILENISYTDLNRSIAVSYRRLRLNFRINESVKILYPLVNEAVRQYSPALLDIIDQSFEDYQNNNMQILTCAEQIQNLKKI